MTFRTEAEMCKAFLAGLPDDWTAYPEACGFDIVLVHETGVQVGVEAKLRLNVKVICQAIKGINRRCGPDFRAVLVPKPNDASAICKYLGITVIRVKGGSEKTRFMASHFWPHLPNVMRYESNSVRWFSSYDEWFDLAPEERLKLPEYVPEVEAGHPSPIVLSEWTIKAMKICVWIEKTGSITRKHFLALKINSGIWMTGYWLKKGDARGVWVPGDGFPANNLRRKHPSVYSMVEADFEKWSADIEERLE